MSEADERKTLQRRIKHQRKELRRLNANLRALDMLVRHYAKQTTEERKHGYRHAAQIAEPLNADAAAAIRKWL